MASNIKIDDNVFVCRGRLPNLTDNGQAFYSTKVTVRRARSVSVDLPGGAPSGFISTKYVHHRIGIAIVSFGDFQSESTLLDPLAKSLLQYNRLLFGDDSLVLGIKVRSAAELRKLFAEHHFDPFEYVVFVGHGSKDGKLCGAIDDISAVDLVEIIEQSGAQPWNFLFLCCRLGLTNFSRTFSSSRACKALIAPLRSVHGAVSAQFTNTFLVRSMLDGETTTIAFKNTCSAVPTGNPFRLWINGKHVK